MPQFAHDHIVPDTSSDLSKKEQVAGMFDDIAQRYDFLNRFLSAGIDQRWRKQAIHRIAAVNPAHILDVATGTADMALMAKKMIPGVQVTGIDISEGMLDIGREKIRKQGWQDAIQLFQGDSEAIHYPENSFDAVMVAFGVRNFQNLELGLKEIRRVLKPGGLLVVLEFSKPKAPVISTIYNLYMKKVTPQLGKMFSKNREAYQYLDASIRAFPEGKNFLQVMNGARYQKTTYKPLSLGICSIYCGEK